MGQGGTFKEEDWQTGMFKRSANGCYLGGAHLVNQAVPQGLASKRAQGEGWNRIGNVFEVKIGQGGQPVLLSEGRQVAPCGELCRGGFKLL